MRARKLFFEYVECSAKELSNYKLAFDKAIEAVVKFRQKGTEKKQKKKRTCPFGRRE